MLEHVNEIKNMSLEKGHANEEPNETSKLTPSQKHAFDRKFANLSSLMGLGGSLRASRVDADELKYSSNFILNAGDALEVAMSCSFSKFSSGDSEYKV